MVWRPPVASNRPGGELHGEAVRTWRRGRWLVDLRRSGSLLEVAAWKPKGWHEDRRVVVVIEEAARSSRRWRSSPWCCSTVTVVVDGYFVFSGWTQRL
ncbi:hypothetical protein M6B38_118155 [Iris pallida]|uniref:Uncharacterized protein n=1 Tax=Iris pallida TaxID=29817 RepID=A0AAX6HI41_IRIPA|nr:hypothetical protein M6B38_118155 [Iris pallida]